MFSEIIFTYLLLGLHGTYERRWCSWRHERQRQDCVWQHPSDLRLAQRVRKIHATLSRGPCVITHQTASQSCRASGRGYLLTHFISLTCIASCRQLAQRKHCFTEEFSGCFMAEEVPYLLHGGPSRGPGSGGRWGWRPGYRVWPSGFIVWSWPWAVCLHPSFGSLCHPPRGVFMEWLS